VIRQVSIVEQHFSQILDFAVATDHICFKMFGACGPVYVAFTFTASM
jgi:hypothetical protein